MNHPSVKTRGLPKHVLIELCFTWTVSYFSTFVLWCQQGIHKGHSHSPSHESGCYQTKKENEQKILCSQPNSISY